MAGSGAFRLLLSGDSMITRRPALGRDEATRMLRALVGQSDIAFTNLEVLPNDFRGYPASESGGTHLAAHSWVVDALREFGFNLFSAATNHALDYSIAGLLATLDVLESKGVAFAGIGRNLAEARMPTYLDHPAGSIALISCCSTFVRGQQAGEQRPEMRGRPGVNPLRYERVYEVTPDLMDAVRRVADALGIERQRQEMIRLGFSRPPESPDAYPFLGGTFKPAERAAIRTSPNDRDLDAIATWVREARGRADLVLVSLHAHEEAGDRERPAEFIPTFAHRMIDEGADLIVGHGPHLLRGMEIYQGKPIFYSLGNFIAQNDLVYKMPADAYERYRIDPSKTPGELSVMRNDYGRKGFPADARYWQSVLPLCDYKGNELRSIELVPVSLGHGEPVHRRGQPRLAESDEAASILARFADLSAAYGTRIDVREDRASVQLG